MSFSRLAAITCGIVTLCAPGVALARTADAGPVRDATVRCSDEIGVSARPHEQPTILGRVALPTFALQAVHLPGDRFPWWSKYGLEVEQGTDPVEISVPPAWRSRAAIGWNNRGGVEASIEHVAPCAGNAWIGAPSGTSNHWLAYPGGFHVTAKGCYPFDVRVGSRRQRVWVKIGSARGCP